MAKLEESIHRASRQADDLCPDSAVGPPVRARQETMKPALALFEGLPTCVPGCPHNRAGVQLQGPAVGTTGSTYRADAAVHEWHSRNASEPQRPPSAVCKPGCEPVGSGVPRLHSQWRNSSGLQRLFPSSTCGSTSNTTRPSMRRATKPPSPCEIFYRHFERTIRGDR